MRYFDCLLSCLNSCRKMTFIKQHITDLFITINTFISKSAKPEFHLLHVCGYQSQGSKSSWTNGETLTCSSCCVTKPVKCISSFSDFFRKSCHFSISSCIICNRSESISRQSYSKCWEHTNRCESYTINTHSKVMESSCKSISSNNTSYDCQYRQPCWEHTYCHTFNNYCCGSCLWLFCDTLCRFVAIRSIVFCSLPDNDTCKKTWYCSTKNTPGNPVCISHYSQHYQDKRWTSSRTK